MYGSKKMYSDTINKPTNMVEKITTDNTMYERFENTVRIIEVI